MLFEVRAHPAFVGGPESLDGCRKLLLSRPCVVALPPRINIGVAGHDASVVVLLIVQADDAGLAGQICGPRKGVRRAQPSKSRPGPLPPCTVKFLVLSAAILSTPTLD